jgi:hypothetical protein
MQVDYPTYKQDSTTDFNINFYKSDSSTGLTLTKARKYFVQLTGFNVIYAYNFLKSLLYSENTIACNIVQTQRLVADEIVCNKIITDSIPQNEIACSIFVESGYNVNFDLTSSSDTIKTYGKSTTINNLIIPNTFNIIVNPSHIVVIYDNKRIVDKINSDGQKASFKKVQVKSFTHLTVKQTKE